MLEEKKNQQSRIYNRVPRLKTLCSEFNLQLFDWFFV